MGEINACELFGVTEEFSDKCAEIYVNSKTAIELFEELRAIAMTPDERDFAMYCYGKATALNDLKNDPKMLVGLLLR